MGTVALVALLLAHATLSHGAHDGRQQQQHSLSAEGRDFSFPRRHVANMRAQQQQQQQQRGNASIDYNLYNFTQTVDHFNFEATAHSNQSFTQRYLLINEKAYTKQRLENGTVPPIFVFTGAEGGDIEAVMWACECHEPLIGGLVHTLVDRKGIAWGGVDRIRHARADTFMINVALDMGALVAFLEMRFFGHSVPFPASEALQPCARLPPSPPPCFRLGYVPMSQLCSTRCPLSGRGRGKTLRHARHAGARIVWACCPSSRRWPTTQCSSATSARGWGHRLRP
jgi:hypothetical protein